MSPALDAKEAAPIWAPTSNTGVVMLTAQPAILPKDATPFVIDAEAAGQSDAQGFHFLHNLKNGERLQILRLAGVIDLDDAHQQQIVDAILAAISFGAGIAAIGFRVTATRAIR